MTTSIHFFDHTAHNYMNAVCDDLNMKYVGSFSADMYDLVKAKERERLLLFAEDFFEAVNREIPTSKNYGPLTYSNFEYAPGDSKPRIDANGKTVTVVTDSDDMGTNLGKMIDRFRKSFLKEPKVINLHDLIIKGGCLGCLQCGLDNICIYRDQDEYGAFYNSEIKTPDILVFAGNIVDRYLSSKWKQFFDRSFFNGHSPSLMGKQMGFILSGPLTQIPNLRQILEGYTYIEQANLVDFVTDEYEDSEKIDALLGNLAERLVRFSHKNYMKPINFLGLGGSKSLQR